VIPDIFFEQSASEQEETIVHEFVHWLDAGQFFSNSPEWIAFAQPRIARVQCNVALFGSDGYRLRPEDREIWTSVHATESLQEALADIYTIPARAQSPAVQRMKAKLEHLPKDEMNALRLMRLGMESYDCADLAGAKPAFEKCVKVFPQWSAPHVWLARLARRSDDDKEASKEATIARDILKKAGLHPTDAKYQLAQKLLGEFWESDLAWTTEMILNARRNNPDAAMLLLDRIHKRGHSLREIAVHVQKAVDGERYPLVRRLIACAAEPAFVEKRINDYVFVQRNSIEARRIRGLWCEEQGDTAPTRKFYWYLRAASDFQTCAKTETVGDKANLARIKMKLGEQDKAAELIRYMEATFGKSTELYVLRIAISEAQNDLAEARRQLRELIVQIKGKDEPKICDPPPPDMSADLS
jgi:tetratricopeptide (TPR) repeat protein